MAEKRMFSKQIIDSDAFLEMPLSTQALYFHLSMRADDDGFLNNAKKVMKIIGANQNDYDLLVAKSFVEKLANNMESMANEQAKQGERLEALEGRDGEKWRTVVKYFLSAVIGLVVGVVAAQIGLK